MLCKTINYPYKDVPKLAFGFTQSQEVVRNSILGPGPLHLSLIIPDIFHVRNY